MSSANESFQRRCFKGLRADAVKELKDEERVQSAMARRTTHSRGAARVVMLLLLCLIAPVHAEGTAAGATATAVAAAAAFLSATVGPTNYWAGKEKVVGDLDLMKKGAGIIRVMGSNLRS